MKLAVLKPVLKPAVLIARPAVLLARPLLRRLFGLISTTSNFIPVVNLIPKLIKKLKKAPPVVVEIESVPLWRDTELWICIGLIVVALIVTVEPSKTLSKTLEPPSKEVGTSTKTPTKTPTKPWVPPTKNAVPPPKKSAPAKAAEPKKKAAEPAGKGGGK